MFGNRGIYHDGWYANTRPISPPWLLTVAPSRDVVNSYKWEPYDLTKDWTQNHDLAEANPSKLHEMQQLFMVEAAKYQVFPLDNSLSPRILAQRPSLTAGRTVFTYSGELTGIPLDEAPNLLDKSYTVTAEIEVPEGGAEGMLATQGGRFGGWGFYVLKGKPVYVWDLFNLQRVRWEGAEALSPGRHTLEFDFNYDGLGMGTLAFNDLSGVGRGGTGVLKVDGKPVATEKMERTGPFILQWDESFDVGADTGTPVEDSDYQVPFRFTGKIAKLTIELKPVALSAADVELLRQKSQRNNAASE